MADILEDLADLHKQATTERSHYYVASCCKRAAEEISKLRNDRDAWKRDCEVYAARMKAEQQFAEAIHKADKEPPEASFDNVEDMLAWLNDEPAGS